MLQVVVGCPRCFGECVVGGTAQIVEELLGDLVAGAAEPGAGSLTDQAVGPQPPSSCPTIGTDMSWVTGPCEM